MRKARREVSVRDMTRVNEANLRPDGFGLVNSEGRVGKDRKGRLRGERI